MEPKKMKLSAYLNMMFMAAIMWSAKQVSHNAPQLIHSRCRKATKKGAHHKHNPAGTKLAHEAANGACTLRGHCRKT